jgi:hypothetical protein
LDSSDGNCKHILVVRATYDITKMAIPDGSISRMFWIHMPILSWEIQRITSLRHRSFLIGCILSLPVDQIDKIVNVGVCGSRCQNLVEFRVTVLNHFHRLSNVAAQSLRKAVGNEFNIVFGKSLDTLSCLLIEWLAFQTHGTPQMVKVFDREGLEKLLIANWTKFLDPHRIVTLVIQNIGDDLAKSDIAVSPSPLKITISHFQLKDNRGFEIHVDFAVPRKEGMALGTCEMLLSNDQIEHQRTLGTLHPYSESNGIVLQMKDSPL